MPDRANKQVQGDASIGATRLREVQAHLRTLQAAGVGLDEIRKDMVYFGFGNVSLEEFLSLKSVVELVKIIESRRQLLN